jgi:hypothetical protein
MPVAASFFTFRNQIFLTKIAFKVDFLVQNADF